MTIDDKTFGSVAEAQNFAYEMSGKALPLVMSCSSEYARRNRPLAESMVLVDDHATVTFVENLDYVSAFFTRHLDAALDLLSDVDQPCEAARDELFMVRDLSDMAEAGTDRLLFVRAGTALDAIARSDRDAAKDAVSAMLHAVTA